MNWDKLSWLVVGACVAGAGLFVIGAAGSPQRTVSLPPPPEAARELDAGVGPVASDAAVATALAVDAAAVVDPAELPEVCRPLVGKVPGFPSKPEERVQFCLAWTKLVTPTELPQVTGCGPSGVVKALQALDTCLLQNDVCETHGAGTLANVDVRDIVAVSDTFHVHVSYFPVGSSSVRDADALRAFVEGEVTRAREEPAFMIFGSASPTAASEQVDVNLARGRTEAAFAVVNRVLRKRKMYMTLTRKANIGRGLAEDICAAMKFGSAQRAACEALDVNSRRQAAFVVAYPRRCLEAGKR